MKTFTTIGIDPAKNSFSVYGVDAEANACCGYAFGKPEPAQG